MMRFAILLFLLLAGPALAHTKSESHSDWRIVGDSVHVTFTLPEIEARRLTPDGAEATNETIARYLTAHLGAAVGETDCPPAGPVRPVAAVTGFRRFELSFACPQTEGIALHSSAFFDLVPSHVTFAQITDARGRITEQLFTHEHETLAGGAGDNPLQDAGFLDYIRLGMLHILTGLDHMSFLLGLVLISRRVRDLVFVVTGFTLGHSLTLALAVTGILRPRAQYIDALIGLTIALIGAENVAVASRRPGVAAVAVAGFLGVMALGSWLGFSGLPPLLLVGAGLFAANYLRLSGHLVDAARLRLVVTLVFGLIHGFGFAADLLEMRLPTGKLAELLVGFNLGVEIGQLSLVLAMIGAAALLARIGFGLPRRLVVDLGSAALVAFGVFLLVTRSYG
ncbi:MAG: HupE/UreJ family protein [Aliidongia sp.]